MVDILEGDFKINTTNPAQWKWEVLEKGTTTVLVSKDMKDINGDPIINVITPVAEQSE